MSSIKSSGTGRGFLRENARLGQLQGERNRPLLPFRSKRRRRHSLHLQPQIVAMRSDRRQAQALFSARVRSRCAAKSSSLPGAYSRRERFLVCADRAMARFRAGASRLNERCSHLALTRVPARTSGSV